MKIIEKRQLNKTLIMDLVGEQVFRYHHTYYIVGQGGPTGKRDCMKLENGKNYQFGNNVYVEHFPYAILYLEEGE